MLFPKIPCTLKRRFYPLHTEKGKQRGTQQQDRATSKDAGRVEERCDYTCTPEGTLHTQ